MRRLLVCRVAHCRVTTMPGPKQLQTEMPHKYLPTYQGTRIARNDCLCRRHRTIRDHQADNVFWRVAIPMKMFRRKNITCLRIFVLTKSEQWA